MIVTSKDSANPFVNVGTFSKIRKLSVRQKINKHISMLTVIPFFFILLVNFVGIRFDNVFSIVVSSILMVILMWEIYHFARANVLQTEYKYFYSRGVLIVSFVVWLLIQAGFAISATIFRKVTVDEGWFVIDGVYPLLSTPIGIFVWIVYGAVCISLFGKTLFNLSRSSYDDIPEEQFCDKFMDSKAIHEIGDTRERNKFYGYYISFFILSIMGSIVIRWTDSNDNVYFNWFNLLFIGGALISGAIFAVKAYIYKVFKNYWTIIFMFLPFVLLTMMRYGQCIWGSVILSTNNGEEWGELNTILFFFVYVPGTLISITFVYNAFLKALANHGVLGTPEQEIEYFNKELEIKKKKENPEDY